MKKLAIAGVILAVAALAWAGGFKPANKIRVYCSGAGSSGGFVDERSQGVGDSVKDVKDAIAKKKDWLELAATRDDADIQIEVLERGLFGTGVIKSKYNSSSKQTETKEQRNYVVRARMTVGDYSNEITGECSEDMIFGAWRSAAGDIAKYVENWAQNNYERLLQERGRSRTPPPKRR